tara:strand:- start:1043 stop:2056 length:1014 start_codon:yes stop_codon:yes gene_type:complete
MSDISDISDIQQSGDNTELDNVLIETKISKQKRPSIMDMIKEKQNDQDFNQKIGVATTLVLELYKVLMGAMLVIFVPQKCGSAMCSISQNIERTDSLSQSALSFNIITALSFLALYFVEVKRENKMINYLEVNRFTPVDNETVGEALEKLDIAKKQKIWDYDGYYQKTGYASTIAFTLNAILSFIVVYDNYLDSKTITVFLTNILLMGLKVADVFSTVNSKKNVFYSAYLKNKVQYNDVDPDKIMMDTEAESKVEELPEIIIEDIVIDETSESSGKSDLSETNETTPFKESDVSKNTPEMNTQSETNSSDEPLISAASNDIFESSQPKEEELADNSV